jgi:hypothetical protein
LKLAGVRPMLQGVALWILVAALGLLTVRSFGMH